MFRLVRHDKMFSGDSSRLSPSRARRPAFTLTELLVVVALITIMGGTGIGMYANSYKRMMVERAARELMLMAQYGRVVAIEQHTQMTIAFDSTTNTFALTTVQWDAEQEEAVRVVVSNYYCKPFQIHPSVFIEQIAVGLDTANVSGTGGGATTTETAGISFYPNGTADMAVVQFGDGGTTHYTVSISPATGRVETVFGTADQIQPKVVDLEEPLR